MKKTTSLYMTKVNSKPAKARDILSIAIGEMLTVKVPVGAAEGWLNELVVRQVSGTAVAFDVEVLDSEVPYAAGGRAYNALPAATLDLFRVVAKISALAGATAVLRESEMGYSYQNADGSPTACEPYLYLTIIPDNQVTVSTWEVAITTSKEIY
jgi:hypothetical protein